MSSFQHVKQLEFAITLGTGAFGAAGANSVVLSGLRAIAEIEKGGGQMMCAGRFRIFGLELPMMNQLTTLAWRALSFVKNTIRVTAIDGDSRTLIYFGQIINAWADYASAPDVPLLIEAQTGFLDQVSPVPAKSYPGPTAVATIYAALAKDLGVTFENNDVTGSLASPYFPGTAIDQLRKLSEDSKTNFYLDGGVLAICQNGVARKGIIPAINKDSGLIGYPTFDKLGITFSALFNPLIRFGGQIVMQSTAVDAANGVWQVSSINYHLESEKPGGAWFCHVRCTGNGLIPIP